MKLNPFKHSPVSPSDVPSFEKEKSNETKETNPTKELGNTSLNELNQPSQSFKTLENRVKENSPDPELKDKMVIATDKLNSDGKTETTVSEDKISKKTANQSSKHYLDDSESEVLNKKMKGIPISQSKSEQAEVMTEAPLPNEKKNPSIKEEEVLLTQADVLILISSEARDLRNEIEELFAKNNTGNITINNMKDLLTIAKKHKDIKLGDYLLDFVIEYFNTNFAMKDHDQEALLSNEARACMQMIRNYGGMKRSLKFKINSDADYDNNHQQLDWLKHILKHCKYLENLEVGFDERDNGESVIETMDEFCGIFPARLFPNLSDLKYLKLDFFSPDINNNLNSLISKINEYPVIEKLTLRILLDPCSEEVIAYGNDLEKLSKLTSPIGCLSIQIDADKCNLEEHPSLRNVPIHEITLDCLTDDFFMESIKNCLEELGEYRHLERLILIDPLPAIYEFAKSTLPKTIVCKRSFGELV